MKVHIFHIGKVDVYPGTPIRDPNPFHKFGIGEKKSNKLKLPVSSYLIEHNGRKILIDTGWSREIAKTGAPWPLSDFAKPLLKKEDCMIRQLKKMHIDPSDLDGIWLSHLDFDHTSGLQDFTAAKSFHASAPEVKDKKFHLLRYQKNTFDMVDIQLFEFEETGIGPAGKRYDVFGDGSVVLINTPGHTDGLFSTKITAANGQYIIQAADTFYLQKSIKEEILPGYCMSTKEAKKSVEWLKECSKDPSCLLIAGNHDPAIQPQTIWIDEKEDRPIEFHPHQ